MNFIILFSLVTTLMSSSIFAEEKIQVKKEQLLDRVQLVIDSTIYNQSQLERIIQTYGPRRNISPFIYIKEKIDTNDINNLIIQRHIVRDKLTELGFPVDDGQVEAQIRETESRLGFTREQLLTFLASNKISFHEYFELIREALEFNLFNFKVIIPTISVSEQEMKNKFSTLANVKHDNFVFNIIDFTFSKNDFSEQELADLPQILSKYQQTGELPKDSDKPETTELEDVHFEGLVKEIQQALTNVAEGNFSKPVKIAGQWHVFFLKSKETADSTQFQNAKNDIRNRIYEEKAKIALSLWLERERNKHFIQITK